MNSLYKYSLSRILSAARLAMLVGLAGLFGQNAFSQEMENFAEGDLGGGFACEEASPYQALPGHILKEGKVRPSPYGWSFFFPDYLYRSQGLQRVNIAQNAGIIGGGDFFENISSPRGMFVVAQIFVGDNRMEPVVTCISTPIPLSSYAPERYGYRWSRSMFEDLLGARSYYPWRYNQHRDVLRIRKDFRQYRHKHRDWDRKFFKARRNRDDRNDGNRNDRRDRRDDRRDERDDRRDGRDDRRGGWRKTGASDASAREKNFPAKKKPVSDTRKWRKTGKIDGSARVRTLPDVARAAGRVAGRNDKLSNTKNWRKTGKTDASARVRKLPDVTRAAGKIASPNNKILNNTKKWRKNPLKKDDEAMVDQLGRGGNKDRRDRN